jgi:hypothetical protein
MDRNKNDEGNSVRITSPLAESQTQGLLNRTTNHSTMVFNFIPLRDKLLKYSQIEKSTLLFKHYTGHDFRPGFSVVH